MNVKLYIILSIGFLCLIGVGIALIIINNNKLNKIGGNKTPFIKNYILMTNQNITSEHTYGKKISLEYDKNKRFTVMNLYGNLKADPTKLPSIGFAFSDTGNYWNLPGEETHATLLKTLDDRYSFMLQLEGVSFKYVTVYIKGQAEDMNCSIKLSN